ncbi:MAG: hypothetical protein PHS48_08015, partial [Bacteroidales bacterium]|nr:hypothetical protein [Bacteroidales bacterium]
MDHCLTTNNPSVFLQSASDQPARWLSQAHYVSPGGIRQKHLCRGESGRIRQRIYAAGRLNSLRSQKTRTL